MHSRQAIARNTRPPHASVVTRDAQESPNGFLDQRSILLKGEVLGLQQVHLDLSEIALVLHGAWGWKDLIGLALVDKRRLGHQGSPGELFLSIFRSCRRADGAGLVDFDLPRSTIR